MNKLEQSSKTFVEGRQNVIAFVKNRIFDFVGIAIVAAMLALMLNIVEGRKITLETLLDVLVQLVPFYICAMMLSLNYYRKGAYTGKRTESFISITDSYSDIVSDLKGDEIRHLNEFCIEYNEIAKKDLQVQILKSEGVEYNDYINEYIYMTYWQVRKKKGKLIAKAVRKAKKIKVEGISVNILLGNSKGKDITDLGPTESQLIAGRGISYALGYIFTIGFLTFLVAKNITDWNWMRMLYELAKVIYIFVRSYMRYFEGYEDITIRLANSITRKTDILKSYTSWYKEQNFSQDESDENTETIAIGAKEIVTNN